MSVSAAASRLWRMIASCGGAALVVTAVAPVAYGGALPTLASHRAVYDLSLVSKDASSAVSSVRGRMVHEFVGAPCDGYAVNMRWVAVMTGESDRNIDDVRFASWEDAEGASYSYTSTRYLNDELVEEVKAQAVRGNGPEAGRIVLSKPTEEKIRLPAHTVFPTTHLRNVIEAAISGRTFAQEKVYDVSEDGQEVYETLAVVGSRHDAGQGLERVENAESLKDLPAWRVTISYFKGEAEGEETPAFEQTFDLFANGIAANLLLNYGDIVIKGTLTDLELLDAPACPG